MSQWFLCPNVSALPSEGYEYMFMNKISISQTCLYNISNKKATEFLHQQRAFGYSLVETLIHYSIQSSDSRRLLGGV